ncbi:MAG: ATP synthase F1 subunit epsilon [Ignavibacteria bacterium]|jgi:F-type H+-transporting ATPase subunit epsilon
MSEHLLDIDIVTPQRIIFSGKCISVAIPGAQSPFQVLYNHAPIVSALEVGAIKIVNEDNSEVVYATEGGFVEVLQNRVSIVVETAEQAAEINTEAALASIAELQQQLEYTTTISQREQLKHAISIQENRVRIAGR